MCAATVLAQIRFTKHHIQNLGRERIAGYAISGRELTTWGDRLRSWSIPDGKVRVLGSGGPFGEGGAIIDVNRDGQLDVVAGEMSPRALVWFEAPRWTRHVIDTGVDTADVIPADLFGRRGILLVHRRAQVRFYEIPRDPSERWPVREIYSFYTPSDQGGLAIADIDTDGRPDILCGNYWIRSPESFELPWRLFAIELWNEHQPSAMLRLAWMGPRDLIATQREMPDARLALFERPADPRQLWTEHRIADGLSRPHSLDVADFDDDGRLDVLVAEQSGSGRLLIFRNEAGRRFTPQIVATGVNAIHARSIDWDGDGRRDILTISEQAISYWRNESR